MTQQRQETIRSLARLPLWTRELEHMVPSGLRAEVEAEAARQEAERQARDEVNTARAAKSWEDAGLSGTRPTFLDR